MKRRVTITADGSKTIYIEDWNEHYHSKHGAIQEARHVFIEHGFNYVISQRQCHELRLLEIGFGTGLNAYLTYLEARDKGIVVDYEGIDAYPVTQEELQQLNFSELVSSKHDTIFDKMHSSSWESNQIIDQKFTLTKRQEFFTELHYTSAFDLIYFDAFGSRVQPELWEKAMFKIMYDALKPKGVLVTYSAKGDVRRGMTALGFTVERLPGPPGKRHMLRATK